MIIDIHAHIFPDRLAKTAVGGIGDFYDRTLSCDGTADTLIKIGHKAGISKFAVHSAATSPRQVKRINDFLITAAAEHPDDFIGFITLHPDYDDNAAEIERGIAAGARGIKLHPDFQKFRIDDKKAYPIYEEAQGRLPILFHMGDTRYSYSRPEYLLKVISDFPKLDIIGAHFGGWSEWDRGAEVLAGTGIFVDCSSARQWMTKEHFVRLIDTFGTERVIFGSDYPMWNPHEELEYINSLKLPQEARDRLLYKNAAKVLKIES